MAGTVSNTASVNMTSLSPVTTNITANSSLNSSDDSILSTVMSTAVTAISTDGGGLSSLSNESQLAVAAVVILSASILMVLLVYLMVRRSNKWQKMDSARKRLAIINPPSDSNYQQKVMFPRP